MLSRVLDFLAGREGQAPGPIAARSDDLQSAVAALLIEAAHMDNDFDAAERATIEHLLAHRFKLDAAEIHRLIEQATLAIPDATQMFPFTRRICEHIDHDERIHILEMLWKVAYADGTLDPHEDMMLRRVAGLIHVPDRERAMARRRALAQTGAA